LSQAITYTWVSQGLLAMLPWAGDPDIATAVRTGTVSYDRLRPLDFYSMWYARATGWVASRTVPRVLMMFLFAAILLPLPGWGEWAWKPPVDFAATFLFVLSIGLSLLYSAAFVMLINICVAATLNARGINAIIGAPIIVFSGNLMPLSLFPDWMQTALLLQPFAGLLDIPLRIYFGQLEGLAAVGGLALQAFWIGGVVLLGRWWLSRVLRNLEMQGG
jgi:ABC-2 type transport system permease protein